MIYPEQTVENFWRKVNKTDDCWAWTGSYMGKYGAFYFNGKNGYAHRFSWSLHNGDIQDGMDICHTCDNPMCVNPAHLFPGSRADNMADMKSKGRARYACGEHHCRAKLSVEDVKSIRSEIQKGTLQVALAKIFGVSHQTISDIHNKLRWKQI